MPKFGTRTLIVVTLIAALICGAVLPMIRSAHEAARGSWRSQVYPVFMEQSSMFYDTTTSWDSTTNMRLLNGTPISLGSKDGTTHMATLNRYPWAFTCLSNQR